MVVRDGLVLSCVPFWPAHRVTCILYPVPQVVIFSAPAPEGIRKAIDFPKLFYSQAAHATKKLCVGKQVHVFVQFGCKVPGHLSTAIVVPVTLWYVINVMEDQTVPIQVLHGFLKTNVEKHGSVKGLGANLLDHIEGKLQALALKHGEQVSQEDGEVLVAVPERDEDGHSWKGVSLGRGCWQSR